MEKGYWFVVIIKSQQMKGPAGQNEWSSDRDEKSMLSASQTDGCTFDQIDCSGNLCRFGCSCLAMPQHLVMNNRGC